MRQQDRRVEVVAQSVRGTPEIRPTSVGVVEAYDPHCSATHIHVLAGVPKKTDPGIVQQAHYFLSGFKSSMVIVIARDAECRRDRREPAPIRFLGDPHSPIVVVSTKEDEIRTLFFEHADRAMDASDRISRTTDMQVADETDPEPVQRWRDRRHGQFEFPKDDRSRFDECCISQCSSQ